MADDPKYKRLTRARPRSRFALVSSGNTSLWLGPDHLLCIESTGFTESYKRFYFRDIQAFIIRKTDGYKYASLVLGLLGVFLSVLGAVSGDRTVLIVMLSIAAFFWLCMLLNLLLGATAACSLQTAVQVEPLPSIHRLRKARDVLSTLRPLIASAQGGLTPEEIAARFRGTSTQPAQQPSGPIEAPPVIEPPSAAAAASTDDPNAPPKIVS